MGRMPKPINGFGNIQQIEIKLTSIIMTGSEIQPELLAHLSVLGWEHIGLTGERLYLARKTNKRVARDVNALGDNPTPTLRLEACERQVGAVLT
jgi:hypothetical protein